MNEATTIRTYMTFDTDIKTGEQRIVAASAEPPTLGPAVVRDTGKRLWRCAEASSDTLEISLGRRFIHVYAEDGSRTSISLTREAAYELGAALFALADTLRA